jgi:hypothetical protein
MRMRLSFVFSICLVVAAAAACGGGGGGGNGNNDAAADVPVDMPPALAGLGQKCGTGLPACPANAPECFGLVANGTAYCSPDCLTGGAGKTNAQGQFMAITPPPDNAKCTAAFTGTVGMPVCAIILSTTPMDNPLKPNTNYTAIKMGCAVVCGSGATCPPGMACNTGIGPGVCLPM